MISPQNIDDDVIELLGYTALQRLHIIQNRYTPSDSSAMHPISLKAWKQCKLNNPRLAVFLEIESVREKEVLWQEGAPVHGLIYDSTLTKVI